MRTALWIALGAFVAALAVFVGTTAWRLPLHHPPLPNDEADYENIAFQLYQGHGLARNWDDREWFKPYEQWNRKGTYNVFIEGGIQALPNHGRIPNVYRPPAFPIAIAALYAVFGRRFEAIRIANCAFMAATIAVAVGFAARFLGIGPALLSIVTGLADTELQAYAGTILTESMACLGLTVFAVFLAIGLHNNRLPWLAAAGLTFGLLVLVRSIFITWLPLIVVLIWILTRRRADANPRSKLSMVGVFGIAATVILLPWWARNCLLLEAFAPMGTQGPIGLAGAYCDAAYEAGGDWDNNRQGEILQQLLKQAWFAELSPLQQELKLARECSRQATDWIKENPDKLLSLAANRFYGTWWRDSFLHMLFYLPVAIGAIAMRHSPAGKSFIGLLAINTLCLMATYPAGGRFLVPMRPILHILAGAGGWLVFVWAAQRGRYWAINPK